MNEGKLRDLTNKVYILWKPFYLCF